jgi:KRAB domain-containing zinc finger protein
MKEFKCNICDYETAQSYNLKKHIDSIHKRIKPYECNMCEFETAHKPHLRKHINSVHEVIIQVQNL